jgi:hypothetical protein
LPAFRFCQPLSSWNLVCEESGRLASFPVYFCSQLFELVIRACPSGVSRDASTERATIPEVCRGIRVVYGSGWVFASIQNEWVVAIPVGTRNQRRNWHDIVTLDESLFYYIPDHELMWLRPQ